MSAAAVVSARKLKNKPATVGQYWYFAHLCSVKDATQIHESGRLGAPCGAGRDDEGLDLTTGVKEMWDRMEVERFSVKDKSMRRKMVQYNALREMYLQIEKEGKGYDEGKGSARDIVKHGNGPPLLLSAVLLDSIDAKTLNECNFMGCEVALIFRVPVTDVVMQHVIFYSINKFRSTKAVSHPCTHTFAAFFAPLKATAVVGALVNVKLKARMVMVGSQVSVNKGGGDCCSKEEWDCVFTRALELQSVLGVPVVTNDVFPDWAQLLGCGVDSVCTAKIEKPWDADITKRVVSNAVDELKLEDLKIK